MRIHLEYKNLDSTPTISEHVEKQLSKLDKFLGKYDLEGAVLARVELSRTSMHHHKGPVFRAEINLDLPKKVLRASHEDWDIRVAINLTINKLERELVKYKEVQK